MQNGKCVSMVITMQIVNGSNNKDTVVYYYNGVDHSDELSNVTHKNAFKVGAAIGRRRLAKDQVVGVPVSIEAQFHD